MANMIREKFEQEFGKRFEKIEKTLERTFEKTIEKTLKSPVGAKAQAKAMSAKQTLDEVLLGLEHKGYNVKEPQDLIQTVGRKVLERANEIANDVAKAAAKTALQKAEDVRSQVAAKPYSPAWVKDLKIPQMGFATSADTASTAGTARAEAAVPEAELGEQMESDEDSAEERSSGTVVSAELATKPRKSSKASSGASSKKSSVPLN